MWFNDWSSLLPELLRHQKKATPDTAVRDDRCVISSALRAHRKESRRVPKFNLESVWLVTNAATEKPSNSHGMEPQPKPSALKHLVNDHAFGCLRPIEVPNRSGKNKTLPAANSPSPPLFGTALLHARTKSHRPLPRPPPSWPPSTVDSHTSQGLAAFVSRSPCRS